MESKVTQTPPRYPDILQSEIVVVQVGPAAREFRVHLALLDYYSDHFKGAFRSMLLEGLTRKIHPEDAETHIFAVFAKWLYTGQVPDSNEEWHQLHENPQADVLTHNLVCLYIFGDRYLVPSLKETIVESLVKLFNTSQNVSFRTIVMAFNNLPEQSPLLDLLVHEFCRAGTIGSLEQEKEAGIDVTQLPAEFLWRAIRRFTVLAPDEPAPLVPADYQTP